MTYCDALTFSLFSYLLVMKQTTQPAFVTPSAMLSYRFRRIPPSMSVTSKKTNDERAQKHISNHARTCGHYSSDRHTEHECVSVFAAVCVYLQTDVRDRLVDTYWSSQVELSTFPLVPAPHHQQVPVLVLQNELQVLCVLA